LQRCSIRGRDVCPSTPAFTIATAAIRRPRQTKFRSSLRLAGQCRDLRALYKHSGGRTPPRPHLFPFAVHAHDRVRGNGNLIARRAGKPTGQECFELLSIDHGRPHFLSIRTKKPARTIANPMMPTTTPTGSMMIVTPRPQSEDHQREAHVHRGSVLEKTENPSQRHSWRGVLQREPQGNQLASCGRHGQPEGIRVAAKWITVDGNDACADVAYHLSDIIAICPITPSSGMAEAAAAASREGPAAARARFDSTQGRCRRPDGRRAAIPGDGTARFRGIYCLGRARTTSHCETVVAVSRAVAALRLVIGARRALRRLWI
jgi:hypothetical protein